METNNLYLRKFIPSDFKDFSDLIRDKMSSEYEIYDHPFPTDDNSLKNVLLYLSSSEEFFAVVLKAENRVIGFISLNNVDDKTKNLGYCIHTERRTVKLYANSIVKIWKEDLTTG